MKDKLKKISFRFGVVLFALVGAAPGVAGQSVNRGDYRSEIKTWRERQEAELKTDDGWLTVAGLFWLKEGPNRFGTGAGNDIVLPKNSAPGNTGTFELRGGVTTLTVAEGASVTVGVALVSGSIKMLRTD
jgi:hypothetical protein